MPPRLVIVAVLMAVSACAPAARDPVPVALRVESPPPAEMGQVGLMDYIYGPPPRTRVEPGIRCRFHCPERSGQHALRTE